MNVNATTRRSFLAAAGGGTAAAYAVGTGVAKSPLDTQLEEVAEATERYADPRAAFEDGYRLLGPYVRGMGWHFLHPGLVEAAVEEGFDLARPQLLTYGDTGDNLDGLVLGSAEFAIPAGARGYTTEAPPDLFDDEDGSESWHAHHAAEHAFTVPVEPGHDAPEDLPESQATVQPRELLRTTNWIELTPGDAPGKPMLERGTVVTTNLGPKRVTNRRVVVDSTVHPDLLTLHVWVHHENPKGVFVPINPELPNEPTP